MQTGPSPSQTASAPAKERSAHVDTFCREMLPPPELWPVMDYSTLPELAYPPRLNCAGELLDRWVSAGQGDRIAIRAPQLCWSYRELFETSNRIASVLVNDFGIVPGNRVLLRAPNNPMLAACWFAVLKAGAVVVCTVPLLRARELEFILRKARINLCLTDTRIAAELEQAAAHAPGGPVPVIHFNSDAPDSLERRMAAKSPQFTNCDTATDDVALIAFTSGTTGDAKGTVHFHRDVLAICDCFPPYVLKARADDIFCGSPPFAFTFGLGGVLLFPMRIGASTLLLEQATPPYLLKGIHDYRATVCFTSPTGYRAMLPMLKDYDLSSLKKCVSAGEHLPRATAEAWYAATGIKIIDGLGATEMLHIFISAADDDVRFGATGKAIPGYQAKILADDGSDAPVGQIGRLAVRGPTGCRYLDNLERQRAYVHDGWNLTGDSYRMDAEGYFWYHARTDDMIISAGYNISATEVEGVLLEHPDVLECAVVGAPDEQRGTIVKAFIVLRPGVAAGPDKARQLQDYVKAEIAPYKYPRAIEFLDALPRTITGKLQRFKLRDNA
jgi:2-aminobenzoate-CoA ligase